MFEKYLKTKSNCLINLAFCLTRRLHSTSSPCPQNSKLFKGFWDKKIDAKDAWFKIMKNGVSNYTTDVHLKNKTLYVSLSSSTLREELSYGKEKIINLLNEALEKDAIKKIVLR